MKAVIQRVKRAKVKVDNKSVSHIGRGLLVLAGFQRGEREEELEKIARKIVALRIFEDSGGKMNLSLKDINGEILCVSQFTLYGDVRRGRRPSFEKAEVSYRAEDLYYKFCQFLEKEGVGVKRGIFGAVMEVELLNAGPVTIILDSEVL